MNEFYSRYDTHDFTKECHELLQELKDKNDPTPAITLSDVNSALSKINASKAPGPDHVSGKVLKECRLQLSGILGDIFQQSVDTQQIPISWITS